MRFKKNSGDLPINTSFRERRKIRIEQGRESIRKKGSRAQVMKSASIALRVHFLAFVCFMFALGCGEKAPFMQWRQVTQRDFGFRAEFPNDPVYSKTYLDTQEGKVTVHQFQHKSIAFVYYVSVMEFPHKLMTQQPKRRTLQVMMEDQIQGMEGALETASNGTFDGFPSLKFRARLPQDGANLRNENYLTSLMIVRGDSVYRVSAIGMGNEEEVARFLGSFESL